MLTGGGRAEERVVVRLAGPATPAGVTEFHLHPVEDGWLEHSRARGSIHRGQNDDGDRSLVAGLLYVEVLVAPGAARTIIAPHSHSADKPGGAGYRSVGWFGAVTVPQHSTLHTHWHTVLCCVLCCEARTTHRVWLFSGRRAVSAIQRRTSVAGAARPICTLYQEVFGAEATVETHTGGLCTCVVSVGDGASAQSISYRETHAPRPDYDGHHLAIYLEDYMGSYRKARDHGLLVRERDRRRPPCARSCARAAIVAAECAPVCCLFCNASGTTPDSMICPSTLRMRSRRLSFA